MVVNIVLGVLLVFFIITIIVDKKIWSIWSDLRQESKIKNGRKWEEAPLIKKYSKKGKVMDKFKCISGCTLLIFIVAMVAITLGLVSQSKNYESVSKVNADTSYKLIQSKITDKTSKSSSLSGWTAFHFGTIHGGSAEAEEAYYEFYYQEKDGKIQEKKIAEKDVSIRYTDGEPKYQIEDETLKLKEPYFSALGIFSLLTMNERNCNVLCTPQGSIQQQYDFSKGNSK